MLFKDIVSMILDDSYSYKNNMSHKKTISKIIAKYEGKEYVMPTADIKLKSFMNTFIVSEDAETEALKYWKNAVMSPVEKPYVVKNPNALFLGNYYIYLERGINVGYIYVAAAFGNVPILPSFFKDDFDDCAVYYPAELIYPHYKFSVSSLLSAVRTVWKNERLYYSKIDCLVDRFSPKFLL